MNIFGKDRRFFVSYGKIALLLYLVAVTVLFCYLLFPADPVREFVQNSVKRLDPNVAIDIGNVSPAFPPGVKFGAVALSYGGDLVAVPAYVRITPGLFSLLGNNPRLNFKSDVFGGDIAGDCRLIENGRGYADIRLSGINLETIDFLTGLSRHRLKGHLDGKVTVEGDATDFRADTELMLSDISVSLATPVLGIETVQFDTITIDVSTTSRRLEVKSCTFGGSELEGEFTGSILIREPFKMSILNLKGFLKPQAALIKKADNTLPLDFLMKNESGAKGFPVRLRGTFQRPDFDLR